MKSGSCLLRVLLAASVLLCACSRSQDQATTPAHSPDFGKHTPTDRVPGAASRRAEVLMATLATLNLADPVADLDANLAKQDKRFIGINGYTCDAPGISNDDYQLVHSSIYGLKCLEGTSDAIQSDADGALLLRADAYAKTYNLELRRRVRAGLVN